MKSLSAAFGAGVIAIALGGCASTGGGSGKSSAANSAIGCDFDAKRVCQGAFTQSITMGGGGGGGLHGTADSSLIQQNGPVTENVTMPLEAPGGSRIDVTCRINFQSHKVIYAEAAPAGAISDSDRNWIQQSGYCAGEPSGQVAGSPRQ